VERGKWIPSLLSFDRRGTRRKGERFGYLRRGTRRKDERFESVRGECEILKL
jgi:hypothetical protein